MNNNCGSCIFFTELQEADRIRKVSVVTGECRRFPPGPGHNSGSRFFPRVAPRDWCGEWKETDKTPEPADQAGED